MLDEIKRALVTSGESSPAPLKHRDGCAGHVHNEVTSGERSPAPLKPVAAHKTLIRGHVTSGELSPAPLKRLHEGGTFHEAKRHIRGAISGSIEAGC